MTGEDWSNVIMTGNDLALQWYATTRQVPIVQPRPTSVAEALTGVSGAQGVTAGAVSSGTIIVLALVAVAAVLIFRK